MNSECDIFKRLSINESISFKIALMNSLWQREITQSLIFKYSNLLLNEEIRAVYVKNLKEVSRKPTCISGTVKELLLLVFQALVKHTLTM